MSRFLGQDQFIAILVIWAGAWLFTKMCDFISGLFKEIFGNIKKTFRTLVCRFNKAPDSFFVDENTDLMDIEKKFAAGSYDSEIYDLLTYNPFNELLSDIQRGSLLFSKTHITPPPKWTSWALKKENYTLPPTPRFKGFLKPLNFIGEKGIKEMISKANHLAERQRTAFKQIKERNNLVEKIYEEACQRFSLAKETQRKIIDLGSRIDKIKRTLYSYDPLEFNIDHYQEELAVQLASLLKEKTIIASKVGFIEDLISLSKMEQRPPYENIESLSEYPIPFLQAPPKKPLPIRLNKWDDIKDFKSLIGRPLDHEDDVHEIERPFISYQLIRKGFTEALTKNNGEIEQLYQTAEKKFTQASHQLSAIIKKKAKLESMVRDAREKNSKGLIARVTQTLNLIQFPSFVPSGFELSVDEESKILILEYQFPDVGSIQWESYSKKVNKTEEKKANITLYPLLAMRLACELARLDVHDIIEAVVVNGWADYIETTTGQTKRAYCCSLFAMKDNLRNINLSSADPIAAFSALKGLYSKSLEITPILPILKLNTEDKRFIDSKEVLQNMDPGENIAKMGWEEFEHLCRELFEKEFASSGATVKVTRTSRDQGVDAVVFDTDPLRGGKIVVQAKRYTNRVDVSAVRDLYGAIINEGAIKGILVTTSHYGTESYNFSKDKPITLINGKELLGLLHKHGYSFKIDLDEAKRLLLQ